MLTISLRISSHKWSHLSKLFKSFTTYMMKKLNCIFQSRLCWSHDDVNRNTNSTFQLRYSLSVKRYCSTHPNLVSLLDFYKLIYSVLTDKFIFNGYFQQKQRWNRIFFSGTRKSKWKLLTFLYQEFVQTINNAVFVLVVLCVTIKILLQYSFSTKYTNFV